MLEHAYRRFRKNVEEVGEWFFFLRWHLLQLLVNLTLPIWIIPYHFWRRKTMNQTKAEIWRYRWLWIGVLAVLAIVLLLGIRANPADLDASGEPIARVTYYLLPDGSVTTVIENIGDRALTLTPDGYLVPEGGIPK